MTDQDSFPEWLWRASLYSLIGVVGITLVVLALILMGVTDPKPIGTLTIDAPLDQVDGSMLTLVEANTQSLIDTPYQIDPPGTIELTASLQSGPAESGYGVWWGENADHVQGLVAVNGNGYLTIVQAEQPIMEWQPWPHVRSAGDSNRLRVDIEAGQVVVRINDEFTASFEAESGDPLQIGLYAESFNTGGAVVAFERIRVWEE
jgi:hypothetical protein